MALRVFSARDLHRLADGLSSLLAAQPSPLCVREVVLVPDALMARFLRRALAVRQGISAQLELLTPEAFLLAAAGEARPPSAVRIFEALALDQAAWRLDSDRTGRARLALAHELARQFRELLWHRDEFLAEFEAAHPHEELGTSERALCAALWRRLCGEGHTSPHAALSALEAEPILRGRANSRVHLFGIAGLAPRALRIFERLAAHCEVNIWVRWPSAHWLLDLPRDPRGPTLFESMGREARDFFYALTRNDEDGSRIEALTEPEPDLETRLGRLQASLGAMDPELARADPDPHDRSLEVLIAPGRRRELEMVKDALVAALEDLPDLRPEDIGLIVEDPARDAPLLAAVFGGASGLVLPLKLWQPRAEARSEVLRFLVRLLEAVRDGMPRRAISELLRCPAFLAGLGLRNEDLALLEAELERAGVRAGLTSAQAESRHGDHSLEDGLDRLLFGALLGAPRFAVHGLWPVRGDSSLVPDALGGLARALSHFRAFEAAAIDQPLQEWGQLLSCVLRDWLGPVHQDFDEARSDVAAELVQLCDEAAEASASLDVVLALLLRQIDGPTPEAGLDEGGISVLAAGAARIPPFRVLAWTGLTAEAHPGGSEEPSYDLLAPRTRPGDPSRPVRGRGLFLEAILSTSDRFILSAPGKDPVKGHALPLSPCLMELLSALRMDEADPSHDPVFWGAHESADLKAYSDPSPRGTDRALLAAVEAALHPKVCRPFLAPLSASKREDSEASDGDRSEVEVPLEDLLRFYRDPARAWLEQRLGVQHREGRALAPDEAPRGFDELMAWSFETRLSRASDLGFNEDARAAHVFDLLPVGEAGRLALRRFDAARRRDALAIAEAGAPRRVEIRLSIGRYVLTGRLETRGETLVRRIGSAEVKQKHVLEAALELAALAAAVGSCRALLCARRGTIELAPVADPRAYLERALDWRERGALDPLPFDAELASSWVKSTRRTPEAGLAKSAAEFAEQDRATSNSAFELVWRGQNPYSGALGRQALALAQDLFGPLQGEHDG